MPLPKARAKDKREDMGAQAGSKDIGVEEHGDKEQERVEEKEERMETEERERLMKREGGGRKEARKEEEKGRERKTSYVGLVEGMGIHHSCVRLLWGL